jgi:hypothetical protein
MKKLLALVLAPVMTLSLAVSANAFKDDKSISDDYADAVAVLNGMGVFKGYEDGSFKPEGDITRAEVSAIVYRVYTQDVKDAKASMYATYNKFSDMVGASWAAGYISYCANAELVKGYPDGTFKPSGNVTGYEVLAMILRVVGYDKNNEFSGADWALNVAKYAESLGILDNVDKSTDLSAPASRELVAELLFQAIQVPTVTYTPAFGYQADKVQKLEQVSIGYKNFKLASDDSEDAWGRPTTKWYKDSDKDLKFDSFEDTYAEVTATPKATFNVETSQCDICEALGVKKTTTVVDTYTNGKLDTKDVTYTATATKAMVGAQGEQIEFYQNADGDYRLVVIDTYLAYVNEVVTEKTDSKNHITRDAYMSLDVYKTSSDPVTLYVKGNDYAEEDWVLVNVNDEVDVSIIRTTNKAAQESDLVEIVAKAESFEGAQTETYLKSTKRTIDKKDYDVADNFYKDDAGLDGSVKYTWFLDQFGNLIGNDDVDTISYAVLKSIKFVDKNDGAAEAVLVYLDGTEETVNVKSIDGLSVAVDPEEDSEAATKTVVSALDSNKEFTGDFSKDFNDASAEVGDTYKDAEFRAEEKQANGSWTVTSAEALVSTYAKYNKAYNGMALYKVETDKDGDVSLQGYNTIGYIDNATIKNDAAVIVASNDTTATSSNTKLALDNNTKFIVRETDDDGNYVYNTEYTLKTLPDYANKSVEAYYTMEGNFVNRVYIKNATDAAEFPAYVFVPTGADKYVKHVVDEGDTYWAYVYMNGELEYIKTSYENALTLAHNEGKLFAVEWNKNLSDKYGYASTVTLVTEATDTAANAWTADDNSDYVTTWDINADGDTIVSDFVWRLTADTKIICADGKEMNNSDLSKIGAREFESLGIWIVSAKSDFEGKAAVVYVGNKLGDSADATVYVNDETVKFEQTATPFSATVTGDLGAAAKVTAEAADKNAVVTIAGNKVFGESKQATVTVVSEDGTATNVYTVTLGVEAAKDATVKYVLKANVNGQVETYEGTWTGNAGTYSGQEFATIRSTYFPTFVTPAANLTVVTNYSTVTAVAGETVTLTYVVNVH